MVPLLPRAHLAPAERAVLDRHRLPRRRPVPGAADQRRQGPEIPEARRRHPVLGAGRGGGRFVHRQLPGHRPGHAGRPQLLARPPGLRVRRSRPPVADRQVPRRGLLAGADAARRGSRPAQAGRQEPAGAAHRVCRGHRPVLRCRPVLRRAYPPVGDGVLALVGGAPVGGRLLRSVRHHRAGLHLRHHGPGRETHRFGSLPRFRLAVHARRRAGDLPPPVLLRHHHAGDGGGRHLQRAGSGPADRARLRGLGKLAPEAARPLDGTGEVAADVLRRRGLLEHVRRRGVRLHDQPAGLAVLRAGPEHHGNARPRGAVRGLRLPRPRLHPAGAALRAA
ncbi:hypothetical protein D3C76_967740 [compost metagenome]